jgi:delta 1-pyrroline-5-carboxylate dehydrogenase
VAEQLLRLLHYCGMPSTDVDFLAGPGATMGEVLQQAEPRSTLFTGSQRVAEKLAVQLAGKVCVYERVCVCVCVCVCVSVCVYVCTCALGP